MNVKEMDFKISFRLFNVKMSISWLFSEVIIKSFIEIIAKSASVLFTEIWILPNSPYKPKKEKTA